MLKKKKKKKIDKLKHIKFTFMLAGSIPWPVVEHTKNTNFSSTN
jgi:hypothetical protein